VDRGKINTGERRQRRQKYESNKNRKKEDGKELPLRSSARLNSRLYKNSFRTAKITRHFIIKKIRWLTLCKEIIPVCCENNTKHINTFCGRNVDL
jgi:hypothetical protein